MIWDWRRGGGKEAERNHLRQMLGTLPAKALLLADAGFTGFDLLWALQSNGTSFILRAGANVRLLKKLGTIQFYVAVIGVLLTYLSSRHRVSKYAVSLLTFVASGQATLEDILPVLAKRQRERDLERARLARKRAEKLAQQRPPTYRP
ncbi:MAG: transposase [Planctomycetota bacterium]